jgi:hypothetical protein
MFKIDFYFWNIQCPINYETLHLLQSLDPSKYQVHYFELACNDILAKKKEIYFPFLLIFNDTIRWHSPITLHTLDAFTNGGFVKEKPYIINQSNNIWKGTLIELNNETIHHVKKICTMTNCFKSCSLKGHYLSTVTKEFNSNFFGYLHFDGDTLVGGVEYIPSIKVPYPIPKANDTAFISCTYRSNSEFDYKAYPLRALEERLARKYKKIIAITGEKGIYPNGNLKWFKNQGYKDEGIISIEKDYAILHLVSKPLSL